MVFILYFNIDMLMLLIYCGFTNLYVFPPALIFVLLVCFLIVCYHWDQFYYVVHAVIASG